MEGVFVKKMAFLENFFVFFMKTRGNGATFLGFDANFLLYASKIPPRRCENEKRDVQAYHAAKVYLAGSDEPCFGCKRSKSKGEAPFALALFFIFADRG